MIIVSDTSVLTNLFQVGQIEILPAVFGKILIPKAVFEELAKMEDQRVAISKYDWLETRIAENVALVDELNKIIDLGESEAIVLALEVQATYLLMDERKGRKKAKEMGLSVTGLMGVLLRAKASGVVAAVRPIVDELIAKSGFRLSREVYAEVIRLAGEEF